MTTPTSPSGQLVIEGRHARVTVLEPDADMVCYVEGQMCDEVRLSSVRTQLVRQNSIILVPGLLGKEERASLVAEIDAAEIERHNLAKDGAGNPHSGGAAHEQWQVDAYRGRFELRDRSYVAQACFEEMLRCRFLPQMSAMPTVERWVWDASNVSLNEGDPFRERRLSSLPYRFADNEPSINRYSEGGFFGPHSDDEALTLNILLADTPGTFCGGGTEFWREVDLEDEWTRGNVAVCDESRRGPPTIRIEPTAGVGVVFNGNVVHAGTAVTAGVRHLLVASLSIVPPCCCVPPQFNNLGRYQSGSRG